MNNRFGQMLRVLDLVQRGNTQDPMELALHLRLPENTVRRHLRELRDSGVLPAPGAANDGASAHPTSLTPVAEESAIDAVARSVLDRVQNTLPANEIGPVFMPEVVDASHVPRVRQMVYQCISERRVLALEYRREGEEALVCREVEPLAQFCHDGEWSFLAFCRLRQDLRTFHHARARAVTVTDRFFEPQRGVSLERFIQRRKVREVVVHNPVRTGT